MRVSPNSLAEITEQDIADSVHTFDWKDSHSALEAFDSALEDFGLEIVEFETSDDTYAFRISERL